MYFMHKIWDACPKEKKSLQKQSEILFSDFYIESIRINDASGVEWGLHVWEGEDALGAQEDELDVDGLEME